MTTNVLFLCPHSAGKSILAATYFRSACARLGVDATAVVAGTEPDSVVMPDVAEALHRQGFRVADAPRLVTPHDTRTADLVISIGCDHHEIPADQVITEWDAPMLSDDFTGSLDAIHHHAEALARELATGCSSSRGPRRSNHELNQDICLVEAETAVLDGTSTSRKSRQMVFRGTRRNAQASLAVRRSGVQFPFCAPRDARWIGLNGSR